MGQSRFGRRKTETIQTFILTDHIEMIPSLVASRCRRDFQWNRVTEIEIKPSHMA